MNKVRGSVTALLRVVLDWASHAADHRFGWDRLPLLLGLGVLVGIRQRLRRRNLHDTTKLPAVNQPEVASFEERYRRQRTADGSYNDLSSPEMGMAGSRFGRNVPLQAAFPDPRPLEPSPRKVSRELLTRNELIAAESVNALVAGWLQFMIDDWFKRGEPPEDNPWTFRLEEDDPWPDNRMTIRRSQPDPTRPPGSDQLPPTYVNTKSHWWDGSQIYGNSKEEEDLRRTGEGGKLRVRNGLPAPGDPDFNPAHERGFWAGVAMMHTLFYLEHNSICDRLRSEYPNWSDDELFEHARLVLGALLAKIHTVEWTPAVISHPTTRVALRTNWWGLAGERLYRKFGRLSGSEVISGIPGAVTQHFGVPYSLTEEFVAVYRMHPLIPDDYELRSAADHSVIRKATFADLAGSSGFEILKDVTMPDLFYSFGHLHPGVVRLHNFPRGLQEFTKHDGEKIDLAAIDILRNREAGIPRYNEFRRLLHLEPAKDFESLTDDPKWAEEIRRVYDGDIEAVDLIVGMYAEPLPRGFAFSDTAFRIFVLMASRRLNSDRFFTIDYRPEVYTQTGLDWIDDNSMRTVLLRHYPQLEPALRGVDNAFRPWARAA